MNTIFVHLHILLDLPPKKRTINFPPKFEWSLLTQTHSKDSNNERQGSNLKAR